MAAAVAEQSAPPASGGGGKTKLDPNQLYLELGRIRSLLTNLYEQMGLPLPAGILDDAKQIESAGGTPPTPTPSPPAEKVGQSVPLSDQIKDQQDRAKVVHLLMQRLTKTV